MTRLTANPAQRISLETKKLGLRLSVVRGKAEQYPHLSLGGLVDGAENKLGLLRLDDCADLLDTVEKRVARHLESLEEAEMASAGQAQDQLLAERGVETFETGTPRSRDGWQWLTSRKPARLTAAQIATGDQYAALYSASLRDTLSTSSNDNGGGDLTIGQLKGQAEARHAMRQRLDAVRSHITASTGSERLANLLERVCGRGETLRAIAGNDERKAGSYEVELRLALDMAGVAFKIGAKREVAA
jgi:hypothetical protein